MPALPLALNVIRCNYTGTFGGSKWANVFHVRFTGPTPGQTDMNSLALALRNAWDSNIKPIVVSQVVLNSTTCVDLSSYSGLVSTDGTSSTGTVLTASQLPASVALVASFKIARRYRGGHPRMYLTGQTQTNTSNATNWLSGWVTTTTTAMSNWRTAINTLTYASLGNISLVALSYYSGGVLRASPFVDPISNVIVHSRIDTMRRRLGKELS